MFRHADVRFEDQHAVIHEMDGPGVGTELVHDLLQLFLHATPFPGRPQGPTMSSLTSSRSSCSRTSVTHRRSSIASRSSWSTLCSRLWKRTSLPFSVSRMKP